ncbi:hypothetical protein [Pseudogemmobacter faecipullorum]|uniref:Uncharacterized protein n=1 Tax=Pseudogemmobacter faecipullorum TaxID=2755041 RepID=A0ABS8CSJ4_9RHOB|nr:hypothetical protein [Pseudogemmobacter faecipullorum]MCB5412371.1 hypothetical protein [Pseudogemmobacter faecipullorum]
MQTSDEKVDTAVYALGLSVATNMELAIRLNDFITQEFQFVVSDDDGDGGATLVGGPGGRADD